MSARVETAAGPGGVGGVKHDHRHRAQLGVRQRLSVMSRKISTLHTQDLDPQVVRRILTVLLAVMVIVYSLQIFMFLLPLLYPSYQTIKVMQVIVKLS